MRTEGQFQQDTPFTDGMTIFTPKDMQTSFAAATDAVLTRNAAGDWSWNQIASKTNIYAIPLDLLFRLGTALDIQQQFGGSIGPIPVQGRPPFTGSSQFTSPTSKFYPKGIRIKDFVVNYQVATNPLTAITCRYDRTVYAEGAGPTVTNILAAAANGLLLTTGTHSVKVTGLAAQSFEVTDLSALTFELSIQTAAACTCNLENVVVHYSYNFN